MAKKKGRQGRAGGAQAGSGGQAPRSGARAQAAQYERLQEDLRALSLGDSSRLPSALELLQGPTGQQLVAADRLASQSFTTVLFPMVADEPEPIFAWMEKGGDSECPLPNEALEMHRFNILHLAIQQHAVRCVEAFLQMGMDANARVKETDNTPLHMLTVAADLNESNPFSMIGRGISKTRLLEIIAQMAALLRDYGADPKLQDLERRACPIMYAIHSSHHKVAAIIVDAYAAPNHRAKLDVPRLLRNMMQLETGGLCECCAQSSLPRLEPVYDALHRAWQPPGVTTAPGAALPPAGAHQPGEVAKLVAEAQRLGARRTLAWLRSAAHADAAGNVA